MGEQIENGWVSWGLSNYTQAPGIGLCFTETCASTRETLGLCLLADGNVSGGEALNFQFLCPFLSVAFMEDLEL